jgi:hypothetical protein
MAVCADFTKHLVRHGRRCDRNRLGLLLKRSTNMGARIPRLGFVELNHVRGIIVVAIGKSLGLPAEPHEALLRIAVPGR